MNRRNRLAILVAGLGLAVAVSAALGAKREQPARPEPEGAEVRVAIEKIVIPEVTIAELDPLAAINVWTRESRRYHPQQLGFNVACSWTAPTTDEGETVRPPRVSIRRKKITSRQLLDEICKQAGLKWWVEGRTVMIAPPKPAPQDQR